jgi:Tfp pilus assembly protein PilN
MPLQLHNLLIVEEKRKVRMRYLVRVLGVGALLCVMSVLMGIVALVPAYALLSGELTRLRNDIALREVGAENRDTVEQEVARARTLLTRLGSYPRQEHVTRHLALALVDKPDSVQVTGLSYEHEGHTLVLEGMARTRADLVGYTALLESREGIERVVLPIANLARNNDVLFSITITFIADMLPAPTT